MKKWWRKFRQLNPPVQWLIVFMLAILGLSLLFAPEPKAVDYLELDFSTTSDTRMYFQNMRSYYYHTDALSKKPMLIYRLKRRKPETDSLSLQFAIIRHPHTDAAYAFAEPGAGFKQYDQLHVGFVKGLEKEPLGNINSEAHLRIAAKVYNSLLNEWPVYILNGRDTLKELYTQGPAAVNAEVSLEDYFRLTNKN